MNFTIASHKSNKMTVLGAYAEEDVYTELEIRDPIKLFTGNSNDQNARNSHRIFAVLVGLETTLTLYTSTHFCLRCSDFISL